MMKEQKNIWEFNFNVKIISILHKGYERENYASLVP